MILIDEKADVKLAEALEALKHEPSSAARYIYFHLSDQSRIPGLKEVLVNAARRHITSDATQIYLCDDGDVCILAAELRTPAGNQFILDIVDHLKRPADDSWVTFNEVALHLNPLLVTVERKLEKRRKTEETQRKLLEQQRQERKRQAILAGTSTCTTDEIKHRRANHATPQLMIIEDDAFSRRLVENVLQKKYALTCLAEANYALDTYARIAPDLLFLDIDLPDVTGHELLERILALDPNAYVVMLSGNADRDNITQAMNKGAKGFVAKPFTREKLFQYIDRCPTLAQKQRMDLVIH